MLSGPTVIRRRTGLNNAAGAPLRGSMLGRDQTNRPRQRFQLPDITKIREILVSELQGLHLLALIRRLYLKRLS